jgi:hypothetical protein
MLLNSLGNSINTGAEVSELELAIYDAKARI